MGRVDYNILKKTVIFFGKYAVNPRKKINEEKE